MALNILVVGNGFDLAHLLPTSYKDFLYFISIFSMYYDKTNTNRNMDLECDNTYVRKFLDFYFELNKNAENTKDFIYEFWEMTNRNMWITYFNEVQISDGWVDFEREISRIVRTLDRIRLQIKQTNRKKVRVDEADREILGSFLTQVTKDFSSDDIYRLKRDLLHDLKRLTRALELYMAHFVNRFTSKNRLKEIRDLHITNVLSFNYTDTYRKYYQEKDDVEYDFIHGYAGVGDSIHTCNLVLGIDEYLTDINRDIDNEFIEFKKFFQRIYKKTGTKFAEWLYLFDESIKEEGFSEVPVIKVYIYGHSLDVTDKEILAPLILHNHTTTTIFYKSSESLKGYIMNLVKLIGEDEVIARTNGYNKSIVFKEIL